MNVWLAMYQVLIVLNVLKEKIELMKFLIANAYKDFMIMNIKLMIVLSAHLYAKHGKNFLFF